MTTHRQYQEAAEYWLQESSPHGVQTGYDEGVGAMIVSLGHRASRDGELGQLSLYVLPLGLQPVGFATEQEHSLLLIKASARQYQRLRFEVEGALRRIMASTDLRWRMNYEAIRAVSDPSQDALGAAVRDAREPRTSWDRLDGLEGKEG